MILAKISTRRGVYTLDAKNSEYVEKGEVWGAVRQFVVIAKLRTGQVSNYRVRKC